MELVEQLLGRVELTGLVERVDVAGCERGGRERLVEVRLLAGHSGAEPAERLRQPPLHDEMHAGKPERIAPRERRIDRVAERVAESEKLARLLEVAEHDGAKGSEVGEGPELKGPESLRPLATQRHTIHEAERGRHVVAHDRRHRPHDVSRPRRAIGAGAEPRVKGGQDRNHLGMAPQEDQRPGDLDCEIRSLGHLGEWQTIEPALDRNKVPAGDQPRGPDVEHLGGETEVLDRDRMMHRLLVEIMVSVPDGRSFVDRARDFAGDLEAAVGEAGGEQCVVAEPLRAGVEHAQEQPRSFEQQQHVLRVAAAEHGVAEWRGQASQQ